MTIFNPIATPRRRRREPVPESAIEKAASSLRHLIQYILENERTKNYRLIGRLSRCQIVRPDATVKVLDFRKDGPVLAMIAGSEQLLSVDPWRGLPAKWSDTEDFCSACLSLCDVCGGDGTGMCQFPKCGGGGRIPLPMVSCPADDCLAAPNAAQAHIKPGCEICHGTGMYVGTKECTLCKGTGLGKCNVCRGTGKRPTGISEGQTDYRLPTCPECGGAKFAHREIPQDLESFVGSRATESFQRKKFGPNSK